MIASASIGATCTTVDAVHDQPISASRARVHARPPMDGRGLREGRRSPARDRAAEDHQFGVERQLADLLARPSPWLTTA